MNYSSVPQVPIGSLGVMSFHNSLSRSLSFGFLVDFRLFVELTGVERAYTRSRCNTRTAHIFCLHTDPYDRNR